MAAEQVVRVTVINRYDSPEEVLDDLFLGNIRLGDFVEVWFRQWRGWRLCKVGSHGGAPALSILNSVDARSRI